ncbi:DUF262 domain-containing protein, partial [Fusobacterium sp.]|uniref:DUF262 domain-containing protein n=1 Tax=Fusobacterium sp. TaxID=68766 RepID=UPI002621F7A3
MREINNKMTLKEMILGSKIFVPQYQRAYSWEVKSEKESRKKQVDLFLYDIEEHIERNINKSLEEENLYVGNFLYEKTSEGYGIIDGQQRLTTIVILLSVLDSKLNKEDKKIDFQKIDFSTVLYDSDDFKRYILNKEASINLKPKDKKEVFNTESARRFVEAYRYFEKELSKRDNERLKAIMEVVINFKCTINIVDSKKEATQIFIFENHRGKNPTNLELLKTKLMSYTYDFIEPSKQNDIIEEIEEKFKNIYTKIAKLERYINEDTVLSIATRMLVGKLKIEGVLIELDRYLLKEEDSKDKKIDYSKRVGKLLECLENTFNKICDFITTGLNGDIENPYNYLVHSLINLGISAQIYPIVVKTLEKDNIEERSKIFEALEKIILRNLFIKTRADLAQRFDENFRNSLPKKKDENKEDILEIKDISEIIGKIEQLLKEEWSYWGEITFKRELEKNGLNNLYATKYILWRYENYLRGSKKIRYNYLNENKYQVEHISPYTENTSENNGYSKYEGEDYPRIINSFGNLMLLASRVNEKIKNNKFPEKYVEYLEEIER